MRELEQFLELVDSAFRDHPTDLVAAHRGGRVCGARDRPHRPAAARDLSSSSQGADSELLPLLTTNSEALLGAAGQMIREHVATYDVPLTADRVEVLIDMVVRLVLSHVMQPAGEPAVHRRDRRLDRCAGARRLTAAHRSLLHCGDGHHRDPDAAAGRGGDVRAGQRLPDPPRAGLVGRRGLGQHPARARSTTGWRPWPSAASWCATTCATGPARSRSTSSASRVEPSSAGSSSEALTEVTAHGSAGLPHRPVADAAGRARGGAPAARRTPGERSTAPPTSTRASRWTPGPTCRRTCWRMADYWSRWPASSAPGCTDWSPASRPATWPSGASRWAGRRRPTTRGGR